MGALDNCIGERIETSSISRRTRKVQAYRYGLLAAHRSVNERQGWVITHLPTGHNMTNRTGLFPSAEKAAAAMIEISTLRNDWLHLEADDLTTLGEPVREIGAKHGGDHSVRRVGQPAGPLSNRCNTFLTDRFV